MADRVDAAMQAVKAAATQTNLDSPSPNADCFELPPRHHSVLPIGERRDPIVGPTRLLQRTHRVS